LLTNELQNGRQEIPDRSKKDRERTRYAQAVGQHCGEIDSLLDLSLSILASTSDFPQKADLEVSLKKAQGLLRNLA
jgi:hypothetical protein